MDIINEDWIIRTNQMADDYLIENKGSISDFSNDQLVFLVYYNFGQSGAFETLQTRLAEKELEFRGSPYNEEYAESIVSKAEEFY